MQKSLAWLCVFLLVSPLGFLQAAELGHSEVNVQREKRNVQEVDDVEIGSVREKRWAMAIPWVLHGLRAAPSLYRALVAAFGTSAVIGAGIQQASNSVSRRVNCCRGHQRFFHHVHNCVQRGGGCCAGDKTYLPSLGYVGIVDPRKVSKRDTSGTCGECYSSYGKCTVR